MASKTAPVGLGATDPFNLRARAGFPREFAGLFCSTRQAFLDHERSRAELKALMPEDAKEAIGHGNRAKRSKSGAISFDLLKTEADHHAAL